MTARRLLGPMVAALFVVLTYLLVQAATPDAELHERTLNAMRSLTLNDAALQRDVLRARTGLLRDYDPLVRATRALRQQAKTLQKALRLAAGHDHADLDRRAEGIVEAVADQEALVETLKSRNALLQNSLTYFGHIVADAGATNAAGLAAAIGEAASAMLRFVQEPRDDTTSRIRSALDKLEQLSSAGDAQAMLHTLAVHGRLVVSILPEVDGLVARLQAEPIADLVRELQDGYLEHYGQAAGRARISRILLYAASVMLAAYIAYLFLQLSTKARSLQARLNLENMIAGMSARFIDLAPDRIAEEISSSMERVARHMGAERAHLLLHATQENEAEARYTWHTHVVAAHEGGIDDWDDLARSWSLRNYVRQRCIYVPSVRFLLKSAEKSRLQACGIQSWLLVPINLSGRRAGFLSLDAITTEREWASEDIVLLRTAAEILASAITRERNESAREALQRRLNQAERLESLGTLAGGVAHEFNNILGGMLGYAELAINALRRQSRPRHYVEQILGAGRRAQGTIDNILAFGRRSQRQYRPIEVKSVITESIDLLRAALPATITLRTRLDVDDASVCGDATQLQQVIMNLCTNAAQAMDAHGTIKIGADIVDTDADLLLSHGRRPPGPYVRFRIEDAGCGIDSTVIDRIFEPFFTTKPIGQGTGLGLPTVHGIVSQHGGALNVRTEVGKGTTFEVYLPRTALAVESNQEQPLQAAPRGHGETVLIVDDEEPLVVLGEEMLASLGYEPVGFNNSFAALEAFRSDPGRFDLLLTDEVMAEMSGTELATAVHQIRPEMPIILMTAHRFTKGSHQLSALGIKEVLKKPLVPSTLAQPLARHLGARNQPI